MGGKTIDYYLWHDPICSTCKKKIASNPKDCGTGYTHHKDGRNECYSCGNKTNK